MYVSGFATTTAPPATRPLPVIASFSCLLILMRNFAANASAIIHPTLWRLFAYSLPGLPRPTINFTGGRVAKRLSVVGCQLSPPPPTTDNRQPLWPTTCITARHPCPLPTQP